MNTDICIASESWLNKSIPDSDVALDGYNIFRAGRTGRGGGVAIGLLCLPNCLYLSQGNLNA